MEVPDRRRRERPTAARTAPAVALVLPRRPVIDALRRPRAVVATATQLGVERVQRLRPDGAGLRPPQERTDMQLQVPGVGPVRGRANVEGLQVPVEQLVQRRARAGAALLVDGVEEPGARGLGTGLLARAGLDHPDEGVPLPRYRLLPAVDADAQRAARQPVDRPALPPATGPRPCHRPRTRALRVTKRVTKTER
ncbi:hypothetical protein Ae706Ps2_5577c [Pseudonocardia sp. Ae706_Ps2]|nr:hypothetical protein Ae505Ps2_5612 [Pseudonocardia sp. Ae505_Ps2]OLM27143.1 hypothetical protein Ae706Ps2_5577c [Pseudonocardia sp. Ae706_Ps2]